MVTTIINSLFSLSLLLSGGHIISTNLQLHHYDDLDYKEIFYLENRESISKNCTIHSEIEDIKKIKRSRTNGEQEMVYKVTKNESFEQEKKKENINTKI
tara:strand:+ start:102 stop:398 length:297 start_codon:yes stop_codon:yes gene_type:complete